MKKLITTVVSFFLVSFFTATYSQIDPSRQWTSYRGNFSSGVLDKAGLPETFSVRDNVNILWKKEIPGMGISSPVIWGDKLFITTAISKNDNAGLTPGGMIDVISVNDSSVHEWKVLCIDKNSGKTIWEKTAFTGIPAMKRHPKSTHANTSMATDGTCAVAFFGSEGLYCYNMDGELLWNKNFGLLKSVFFSMPGAQWEFASSPIIYNGVVIIQCDVLENSFLAAFDEDTGKELWKSARNDYPGWSTPNIYRTGNQAFVVVNGYMHIGGYDFATGKEVWRMAGGGDIPIPAPVIGPDLIYINGAHGKFAPIYAIKKSARGDITLNPDQTSNQYVQWGMTRGGSYISTLLLYNNRLYNLGWNGAVNCYDPLTGKEIYRAKLGKSSSFYASMVASDGRIYAVDESGTAYIFSAGDTFILLHEIPLDDPSETTPAITDGRIYFRTQHGLVAVGKK